MAIQAEQEDAGRLEHTHIENCWEVRKILDIPSDLWYNVLANIAAHFASLVFHVSGTYSLPFAGLLPAICWAYSLLFAGPAQPCFQRAIPDNHPAGMAMQNSPVRVYARPLHGRSSHE